MSEKLHVVRPQCSQFLFPETSRPLSLNINTLDSPQGRQLQRNTLWMFSWHSTVFPRAMRLSSRRSMPLQAQLPAHWAQGALCTQRWRLSQPRGWAQWTVPERRSGNAAWQADIGARDVFHSRCVLWVVCVHKGWGRSKTTGPVVMKAFSICQRPSH